MGSGVAFGLGGGANASSGTVSRTTVVDQGIFSTYEIKVAGLEFKPNKISIIALGESFGGSSEKTVLASAIDTQTGSAQSVRCGFESGYGNVTVGVSSSPIKIVDDGFSIGPVGGGFLDSSYFWIASS